MLTMLFGEGATGAFLRICEAQVSETCLNETMAAMEKRVLGFTLKRFAGFEPANREGKANRISDSLRAKVSRILLRSCGKAPNRVGNSGTLKAPRSGAPNHGGDKE